MTNTTSPFIERSRRKFPPLYWLLTHETPRMEPKRDKMASCVVNLMRFCHSKLLQTSTLNFSRTADFIQVRNYAARKGTRERKLKIAKANKAKKDNLKIRDANRAKQTKGKRQFSLRSTEEKLPICLDDVYVTKLYRWKVYDFAEAIQCHREILHPTMYNVPDAPVVAHIELDMTGTKKNRYVDNFSNIVAFPNIFPTETKRSVLVFCKTAELQNIATDAGAEIVGDLSLIKDVEKGNVNVKNFDYVVAHPNIIPDLISIRPLMKKEFPNVKTGNLGVDVASIVRRFAHGVQYTAKKDQIEQDYGTVEVTFGKLDMEVTHLQENLQVLLRDVYQRRPKRSGPFITRLLLRSPPSREKFKIDLNALLPEQVEEEKNKAEYDSEDEDEHKDAIVA